MAEQEAEERQPIDSITYSILCFLSNTENTARGLRELLEIYNHVKISRSPMYRRLRILVDNGLITEEVKGGNDNNLFYLSDKGKTFILDWVHTLDLVGALAKYTLEYVGSEEYENETK